MSVLYVLFLGLMLAATWQVGNRDPKAWLKLIACRVLVIGWSFANHSPGLVPLQLAFIMVDWRNYKRWRPEADLGKKLAKFILDGPDPVDTEA